MADLSSAKTVHKCIAALVLVAAVVLAYQPVFGAGFIWDDDNHLTNNPAIVGPLGFASIWTSSTGVYYPLVLSTFWLLHALWGVEPLPYHLFTIGMHAACAVLLWRILRSLEVPGAYWAAALWALHPVMVESVAWVTELKNTQSCFFYLLAVLFFMRWSRHREHEWSYALALCMAVFAIASKTSTVILPAVLALCWWWASPPWSWRRLLRLAPFALLSAVAGVWTIWEQKFHSGAQGAPWEHGLAERVVLAGRVVWFYLGKLAWPEPLMFVYPRFQIDATRLVSYLPALLVVACLAALAWGAKRRTSLRASAFAAGYFVVALVPVLGFFDVYFFRYSYVGDHLQYLASMGPVALAAVGATVLTRRWVALPLVARQIPLAALAVLLAVSSWRQSDMYRDAESLWRTTLARNPDAFLAHHNLGDLLNQRGETEEAIAHFSAAAALEPDDASAHNGLGTAYLRQGRTADAVRELQRALAMEPDNAAFHNNLGTALRRGGDLEAAAAQFRAAVAQSPELAEASYNLGNVLFQQGRSAEAVIAYERAAALRPGDAAIQGALGAALVVVHRSADAVVRFERVIAIAPSSAAGYKNLAWVLATSPDIAVRDGSRAVAAALEARRLGGDSPVVLGTLAAAYAEEQRYDEATAIAEQALAAAADGHASALADALRAQLDLYRQGSPFHSRASESK